jgi:hypothetical protein
VQVIDQMKNLTLGHQKRTVYEQILNGERQLCGVIDKKSNQAFQVARQQQQSQQEGYTPPEEQLTDFLMNERYQRFPVLGTVMGGSREATGQAQKLLGLYNLNISYMIKAIELWTNYWKSLADLMGAPDSFRSDQVWPQWERSR